jgi:hypothetical protein
MFFDAKAISLIYLYAIYLHYLQSTCSNRVIQQSYAVRPCSHKCGINEQTAMKHKAKRIKAKKTPRPACHPPESFQPPETKVLFFIAGR